MTAVTFLGAGEMGAALAKTALEAGYRTTVWNRSPGRTTALQAGGAVVARNAADAVGSADLVVVCVFDHASVREVLEPLAGALSGRHVVNLTTTTPDGARQLAWWAAGNGVGYLDGGIMATPEMIGTPAATTFYSGSGEVFDRYRELFEKWSTAEYFGADAGMAALQDLALLAGMYTMFAGFFHGAAMVGAAGVPAAEFAARAVPWLQALAPSITEYAEIIDGGDYSIPGQQSLVFSDLADIVDASRAQGISTELVDAVQRLIHRQIDAGHGADGFARIIESIRNPKAAA